ncbi:hypothetical protein GW17_00025973 [Ensete ventricosum]|nr:hypothetical protein GW17_00025973 [Ensete ventricosum]
MGLITHNMIYVCIGAPLCPVIVDLVIIDSVRSSYHYASQPPATASWDALALFPYPHCTAVAVGVGSRPCGRHCCPREAPRRRAVPPCAGAAPAGAVAMATGLPHAASQRAAAPCSLTAGAAAYARKRRPCRRQPCPRADVHANDYPYKRLWSWPTAPLHRALTTVGYPLQPAWPWVAGPAWGLVVAGRPSSLLPLLRKCSKNA